MNKANYKRLGEYIDYVNIRNKDGATSNLVGVSIEKRFIPSIANTIGTDLSSYKVIEPRQFAYGPVTSRNGEKITVALYTGTKKAIMSQAYESFKIKDEKKLLPEYLMMWMSRPEFDRYARFKSHGTVRELFSWEEMCNVLLPVPPIAEQHKIVEDYQTVERRIRNNERMIATLEQTAQAIYRHTLVEGIDENNLPEGWKTITIREFCDQITSGGTPSKNIDEYWIKGTIPWLKTGDVQNNVILSTDSYITENGLKNSSAKMVPANTVIMAMYGGGTLSNVGYLTFPSTTNQACCNMICKNKQKAAYLYFVMKHKQQDIKRLANGGAQENLNAEIISSQMIIDPQYTKIYAKFATLLNSIVNLSRENHLLRRLLRLMTSKLS